MTLQRRSLFRPATLREIELAGATDLSTRPGDLDELPAAKPANNSRRGRPIVSKADPAKAKRNAQQAALMRKRRAK